jgi:LacI family transcriptional regulator
MEKSSTPTLQDVARLAGVSTATVSRCFNTPDKVVGATRERIMQIVEELGYTPHFGGRALASNRSNTMGAVIPTMENAIFARGIQAFQETLADAGVTLLVASSGYDPEREFEQIRTLVSQGADGLLLIGFARPEKTYDFLKRRQIPYVTTWNYRSEVDCFNIGFDNRKAASLLAQKVIDLGHSNIAMITADTDFNDRALNRVEGVRATMERAGLSGENLPIVTTTYTLESGAKALEELMQQTSPPTAIICGNDVLAAGAVSKAKQLGLKIPEDISITGFDNIDLAEVVDPPLTTVHVPHRRMGETAARILLDIRDGQTKCQNIELDVHIVMRDSLSSPRKDDAR